jgi:hypothetical protein
MDAQESLTLRISYVLFLFMSNPAEMAARHASLLRELAELGMALAREVQADALAAKEPELRSRLTADFHRLARTVRQSMALEARLVREHIRLEREACEIAEQAGKVRRKRKRDAVRAHVEALVWTEVERGEAEKDDYHGFMRALDTALGLAVLDETFDETTVEALISRLCLEIGWTSPETLPESHSEAPPETLVGRPAASPDSS